MATMTRGQLESKYHHDAANRAQKAFAEHVITERHKSPCGKFASWRCGKPNSGYYSFNITIEPGRLFVTGDIGCCVFEREPDMLAWARRAIDDKHYMSGKVPQEIKTKEYRSEAAEAFINELRQDKDQRISEEIYNELQEAVDDENGFYSVLHEHDLYGGDYPDLKDYTIGFLWAHQAAKWFLEHLAESN